jgi:phosphopentomutase
VADTEGGSSAARRVDRVLLLVCDSFGVGAAPDADAYGDAGTNTLGHVAEAVGGLDAPNFAALGLGAVTPMKGLAAQGDPGTGHGRLTERSAGKDSTTGHWEVAGVVLDEPFPTYPDGFPAEVIEPFEPAIGKRVLGNVAASGTEIIAELGDEHVRTGRPIVYTSADSVFQVACHVDVVPLDQLYEWCRIARGILTGPNRVGRVIARPFAGASGAYARTPDRRDFSVAPPRPTLLDHCERAGVRVCGVGKIVDLYGGQGITESRYSRSNDDAVDISIDYLAGPGPRLVMANLVDFDSKYGHRNDPEGYARCVEALDARLPGLLEAACGDGRGLFFLTGDHGCDPTDLPSTDHTREYTPVLAAGLPGTRAVDLGTRACFGDLGATVAEVLGVGAEGLSGESFAGLLGL